MVVGEKGGAQEQVGGKQLYLGTLEDVNILCSYHGSMEEAGGRQGML